MRQKMKRSIPRVGMRIIKSSIAVALCYLVSFLRGNSGIVFYSMLAALWCIQMYVANTWKNAGQRFLGTVIGAAYGLIYMIIRKEWQEAFGIHHLWDAIMVSVSIVIVLYTTVLIKKKQASYFSCVVFLSIVVNHITDSNPYLFVWNRFLDTVIGIVIGVAVNCARLPRRKNMDTLFISGLDGTLLNKENHLSDYSRVELNRILDEGAKFTISTVRTPASLLEPLRDIRLNLPIIAMDGAVLYDIKENAYLKAYIISHERSKQILSLVEEAGLNCFTNVIMDDMLVIYYDETEDEVQQRLVKELRRSPYRNYVKRKPPLLEGVIYFMLLYPSGIIEKFYKTLKNAGLTKELKVLKYPSEDFPGYSYIKIYNKNASKETMIHYLMEQTGVEKTVTFGTVSERYDVVIDTEDMNQTVHMLQRLYEPVCFLKK